MGNLGNIPPQHPQAIDWLLPWGATLRGLRWGNGPDSAHLLHELGTDVDAWKLLPLEIARQLEIEAVTVDLPGHGLSDDPWEPARLPDLLRSLPDLTGATGRRFLIAARDSATAALEQAAALELSGLVCLSPRSPGGGEEHPRSPHVPKLFVAGSLAGGDLGEARRLARACGGWALVTSLPVADEGTSLLTSAWGSTLIEQIVAFLRDCQRRPAHSIDSPDQIRPASPSASHKLPPSPSALGRVPAKRVAGKG
jgi:hypothetical protein